MMYQFPDRFGHWGEQREEDELRGVDQGPVADESQVPPVYDMYPDWSVVSDAQRDLEEARQRRDRDTNGGLGFPTDYGVELHPESPVPSRPISAAVAAVKSEVRLA